MGQHERVLIEIQLRRALELPLANRDEIADLCRAWLAQYDRARAITQDQLIPIDIDENGADPGECLEACR